MELACCSTSCSGSIAIASRLVNVRTRLPHTASTCNTLRLPQPRWRQKRRAIRSIRPNRCVAGPTDAASSSELSLVDLQQQLEKAVADEDYAAAAKLRDELTQRRARGTFAVEEANRRFYEAFQSGSATAMAEVWGEGEHVQCIHPQSECIAGRDAVLKSWEIVLAAAEFEITLEDVRIYAGETDGWVTCVEVVDSGDSRGRVLATNVFEKQGGQWRIVHHHGSPGGRF